MKSSATPPPRTVETGPDAVANATLEIGPFIGPPENAGGATLVDRVVAEYLRRIDDGEPPAPESVIAAHSELADELRE
ncbi:hypothetical protein [Alienimonas chondri]|uniref:Uncharacterized protein n=1 Tax=Alienimonas chondri TaxID=2681879 RepID=A0ABX1VG90_9PLAN|nr:hypothetical protein [Alienimonas chondri]NNJ26282.1 hypothetical protein [Alienimonas chondri]